MIKTAEEIRKIAAPPSKILKDIEKEIIKRAMNGNYFVDYFKAGYKVSTIQDISDPRENDGYCVAFTIKW